MAHYPRTVPVARLGRYVPPQDSEDGIVSIEIVPDPDKVNFTVITIGGEAGFDMAQLSPEETLAKTDALSAAGFVIDQPYVPSTAAQISAAAGIDADTAVLDTLRGKSTEKIADKVVAGKVKPSQWANLSGKTLWESASSPAGAGGFDQVLAGLPITSAEVVPERSVAKVQAPVGISAPVTKGPAVTSPPPTRLTDVDFEELERDAAQDVEEAHSPPVEASVVSPFMARLAEAKARREREEGLAR